MGKRKHKDRDPSELWKKMRRLERRVDRRGDYRHDRFSDNSEECYEPERPSSSSSPLSSADLSSGPELYSDNENNIRSVAVIPEQVPVDNTIPNAKPQTSSAPPESDDTGANVPKAPTNAPELPAEILEALGESKEKEEIFGPKIREEVSKRWGKIIMEGLSKEQRQKLTEKTHIPENFQLLKAPKLNPEISAVLIESTRNRDKRLERAQSHLGLGIAAVTNLMSTLIESDVDKCEIVKKLSETGQILLDLHNQNTITRRKLITYSLDKKFLNIVQGVKRDSFLFGENLGEKIKATKTAERSGLHIKRKNFEPQPSTSYRSNRPPIRQGNLRGSSRQQNQRGRPGGPRAQPHPPTTPRASGTTDRYTSTKSNQNKTTPRTR